MPNNDYVISIRGLSKAYTIRSGGKPRTFGELVANKVCHPFRPAESETFWSIKDVSFDVKHGEVVGLIGRNGAGKSTLLKMLSRITEPTSGKISLYGRVGSLLEVGTGFHPELTGRENIYLNGAILGMTRGEIRSQFNAIVEFAEIAKFLETPVKRYSSGMYVRLAFAVAAHLNPEILVIDEVLAVGDMQFQEKCLRKMDRVAREGRTILFVSHNIQTIRSLCTRCITLSAGRVVADGNVNQCLAEFVGGVTVAGRAIADNGKALTDVVAVRTIKVNGESSDSIRLHGTERGLRVDVDCDLSRPARVNIELRLIDHHGATIGFFSPGHFSEITRSAPAGRAIFEADIALPRLNRGVYRLAISLTDPNVQSHWETREHVRMETEGWPTCTGQVLESGSHAGCIILDGASRYVKAGGIVVESELVHAGDSTC